MATSILSPQDIPAHILRSNHEAVDSQPTSFIGPQDNPSEESSEAEQSLLTLNQHLEVSFYLEIEHLLDVRTVDTPNLLFAQALTILEPTNDQYAVTQYDGAFNWPAVFSYLKTLAAQQSYTWKQHEFYVVEFRSKLKENIDRELLFKLDKESHREATQSGGLLKYWFGSPNAERRNLATCLWRGKEDAINGGKGAWHKQARGVISQMYEEINVKGLRLTIDDDIQSWSFERFSFH